MKFEKIKEGMILYDVHSYKMGNTTIRSLGIWEVKILEINRENRTALASWNGNPPKTYGESSLKKLKAKRPVLVPTALGKYRIETREERARRLEGERKQ